MEGASFLGSYINLNCEEYGWDAGDCTPPEGAPANPAIDYHSVFPHCHGEVTLAVVDNTTKTLCDTFMTVETSGRYGAGSSSSLRVVLHGAQKKSEPRYVHTEFYAGTRAIPYGSFECDLGRLRAVTIAVDSEDAWNPVRMSVAYRGEAYDVLLEPEHIEGIGGLWLSTDPAEGIASATFNVILSKDNHETGLSAAGLSGIVLAVIILAVVGGITAFIVVLRRQGRDAEIPSVLKNSPMYWALTRNDEDGNSSYQAPAPPGEVALDDRL